MINTYKLKEIFNHERDERHERKPSIGIIRSWSSAVDWKRMVHRNVALPMNPEAGRACLLWRRSAQQPSPFRAFRPFRG
jgi:hypothetical protein